MFDLDLWLAAGIGALVAVLVPLPFAGRLIAGVAAALLTLLLIVVLEALFTLLLLVLIVGAVAWVATRLGRQSEARAPGRRQF